jgi:hypothetical protein
MMRNFLKRLVIFVLFLVLFFVMFMVAIGYLNKKLLIRYAIVPGVTTVIMGDSHAQWAIDDRRLPNALNLAQMGETYMFTYFKLKLFLEGHSSVNKVLLGFSYHNFVAYLDRRMFGVDSMNIAPRYFFLLSPAAQWQILWNKKQKGFSFIQNIVKTGFYNVVWADSVYSFTGGYHNDFTNTELDKRVVQARIKDQYYQGNKETDYSAINIFYLNKIVELCRKKNAKLILLQTPMSSLYKQMVPVQFKIKLDEFVNMNNLRIIRFDNLNLDDSSFLADGDHVSQKGAMITTDSLKSMLNKD